MNVETGARKILVSPMQGNSLVNPHWSPNGQLIAYHENVNRQIGDPPIGNFTVTGLQQPIATLYSIPAGQGVDWSPDSTRIVYDDFFTQAIDLGIYVADIDGTNQQLLYKRNGFSSSNPMWSPDGRYIAFFQKYDGVDLPSPDNSIWIMNSDGSGARAIPDTVGWIPIDWSPDSTRLLALSADGIQVVPIDGGQSTIIGQGSCAAWQSFNASPEIVDGERPGTCDVSSIQVDVSQSSDVVSGNVSGLSGCEAMLEVHNDRGYWVNLRVTPIGNGLTIIPAGDGDNLYAVNGILAPNESVRYLARFTAPGQTVTAFLDVTTTSGEGARLMNLVQAEIDLISLLGIPVPTGTAFRLAVVYYPEIVNAFGAMPHMNTAAEALFNIPPDLPTFISEIRLAEQAGEFGVLGSTLQELGWDGAVEVFQLLGQKPGKAFGILRVIQRNFGNIFSSLFGYPAGFIVFKAQSFYMGD